MNAKKALCAGLIGCVLALSGCAAGDGDKDTPEDSTAETREAIANLPQIDMSAWHYEQDADVYWQTGISYCADPADASYETLGIYVPGAYFSAADNGDGTYTCEVDENGKVNGFTAQTAPMVLPVETPGYTAMAAPNGYSAPTSAFTDEGIIYVHAGCRGRDAGAPAGVTDLKAAIRYVRYNDGLIPGDTDRIFSFGMSGGGGQSAVLGASGDSDLYTPYLEAIGAVADTSDAVAGSMCWCPITTLGIASEAYEWNMGVTRTDPDAETQALSDSMAQSFADYINSLGLTDADGNALTLEPSDEGIYQAGSYYDYLKSVIEESLNDFLAVTEFPYTVQSGKGGFGGATPGNLPEGDIMDGKFADEGPDGFDGQLPDDGDFGGRGGRGGGRGAGGREMIDLDEGELPELPDGAVEMRGGMAQGGAPDGFDGNDYYAMDGIERTDSSGTASISGTYDSVEDYIAALNEGHPWVTYDSATNTATVTSIADFVSALKTASKGIGAFDDLDLSQGENTLFGFGDGSGAHFDAIMAELLAGSEYEAAFAEDLAKTDALGTAMQTRVDMYDPLYYLIPSSQGYDTSDVAKYWRIRSGINQSDTALSTEVNLALALEADGKDVDFETVWGQAHVEAELEGDSTENFIEWVLDCCK